MDTSTLNLYAIGGFLLLNLIIGIVAGRGVKDIRDYALANKSYGIGIITVTFLATYFDAYNVINIQQIILKDGLIAAIFQPLATCIILICCAIWVAPKIRKFTNCLTLGDIMGVLYGNRGGQISSVISSIYVIGVVCIQIIAFGKIFEALIGWDYKTIVLICGSVLVIYSTFGGVKAVTTTDLLQYVVIIVVLPFIAITAINKAGGLKEIFQFLPAEKTEIINHPKFQRYSFSFLAWLIPDYIIASPPILQRLLMVSNKQKASNILVISSIFIIIVCAIGFFTCMAVLKINPDVQIAPGAGFIYIIKSYFSPAVQSICLLALLSIMMSTIDSFLNSGGIIIAKNVVMPFLQKFNICISDINLVRICTLILGFIGIIVATKEGDLKAIFMWTINLSLPLLAVPLLVGILGLKTDFKSFIISLIITFPTACLLLTLGGTGIANMIFGTSLVSYFIPHIIQNKGILIRKNAYENVYWHPSFHGVKNFFYGETTWYVRLNNYLLYQFCAYNPQYVALAFTVCFSYMFPYLSPINEGGYMIEIIKLISACLCIALLLKPIWPQIMVKRLHLIWHFVLFYCLPFTNTALFLINHGTTPYLVNLVVTVILISYFVDVKTFLFMNIAGGFFAYLAAKSLLGYLPFDYDTTVALICIYLGGGVVGLIFAHTKQKALQMISLQNTALRMREEYNIKSLYESMNTEREIIKTLGSTELGLADSLNVITNELKAMVWKQQIGTAEAHYVNEIDVDKFYKKTQELSVISEHITKLAQLSSHYMKLKVTGIRIKDFADGASEILSALAISEHSVITHTKQNKLRCDYRAIMHVLHNAIDEFNEQNVTNRDLIIDLSDTELTYTLSFLPDYKKKIQALRITITTAVDIYPSLYKKDYTTEYTRPSDTAPLQQNDVPKVQSDSIIAAHYGISEVIDSMEDGYTMIYVLPIDLLQIRPKPVDMPPPGKDAGFWPDHGEAENELRKKITEKASNVDLHRVNRAIELMKRYHKGQFRKTGEEFYKHPIAVAKILLDFSQKEELILAALLHDTLEDTALHPLDIKTIFGPRVAALVLGLTKIDYNDGGIPKFLTDEENLQFLQQADAETLLVKLADRMHNMRTIDGHETAEKRRALAQETLDFFVPLAKNLGATEVYNELKTMCERVLAFGKLKK